MPDQTQMANWLIDNWLGIAGTVIGLWTSFALRPRPNLRYWMLGDGPIGTYLGGSKLTKLHIRNAGSETVSEDRWRTPLVIESTTTIEHVTATGVSHVDIRAAGAPLEQQRNVARLSISHLEPGDEVSFEVRHEPTYRAPYLRGEIQGHREGLARRLTVGQRAYGLALSCLYVLPMDYLELACLAWLFRSHSPGAVWRWLLFGLSSPLPTIAAVLLLLVFARRENRAAALAQFGCALIAFTTVLRPVSLLVAWLVGAQLWYPELALFAMAQLLIYATIGVGLGAGMGLSRPEHHERTNPLAITVVGGVTATVFVLAMLRGVEGSSLILLGVGCTLLAALVRLDPAQLRHRLTVALGGHRRQLLPPQS